MAGLDVCSMHSAVLIKEIGLDSAALMPLKGISMQVQDWVSIRDEKGGRVCYYSSLAGSNPRDNKGRRRVSFKGKRRVSQEVSEGLSRMYLAQVGTCFA